MQEPKNPDGDPNELPDVASDYIKLVIRKMRYRKKVGNDVQEELTNHFLEALDGCKTEQEKDKRAKELINDFGDAKLLGILLRRAKKRCRPLWRIIIARTFQTIGVLIVLLILYLIWFASGRPVIAKDYIAEYNKLVCPAADESLNASPFYNRAARILEEVDSETLQLLGNRYDKATDEDKITIRNWLQENKQAIELTVAGTNKPYYWRSYESSEGSMLGVLMPYLSEYRIAAYALQWRAWLSAEQGRFDDAFDDIRTCYRLGQHLTGDTVLIEQLLGMAIRKIAMRALRTILSEHNVPTDTMTALQKDLEAMTNDNDFVVSVKTEKLFMLDEIQRCFTESRFGPSHIYPRRILTLTWKPGEPPPETFLALGTKLADPHNWWNGLRTLLTHPGRYESIQTAESYWRYWETMATKIPAQLAADGVDAHKDSENIVKGNVLLSFLAPAMARVNEICYRNKIDVEATMVILAMLRYKENASNYPETLVELVATDYLLEVPIDPFSDGPLSYRKTEDGFILYSFGENMKDDGGQAARDDKGEIRKWAGEGDWVFWPAEDD